MRSPVFCTLFDSNYLDKGLVMNESLESVCENFVLYILAMDERCFEVLTRLKNKHIIPISLTEFNRIEELEDIYKERPRVEFLWTCSSHLIDYILVYRNEQWCTYIDADLLFYSDPTVLLDEMGDKTVQIIEHRFTNSYDDRKLLEHSGRFCVEFNTFCKEEQSLKLLSWWKQKCRESCSSVASEKVFGDQKYLVGWEKYEYVSIVKNLGGGLAPWNIGQYRLKNQDPFELEEKKSGRVFRPVFYHFHNIAYHSAKEIDINVFKRYWHPDKHLIMLLYEPYLKALDEKKDYLRDVYNFYPLITIHPAFVQARSATQSQKNTFIKKIAKLLHKETYIKKCFEALKAIRRKINSKADFIRL